MPDALSFDNSYARELEGCFLPWPPAAAPRPRELYFNHELAAQLSPAMAGWPLAQREAVFAGNEVPAGALPIAQAYAGHQFGGFSPQLGDGRALLLGEVLDAGGRRWDIAFKGSGRTPFSRGGDGKAAVGPMLREVLISESLHALGVLTTRALAVVATGDMVHRERSLPGAVLTRVAASHLRVGTFEYFAARGDVPRLKRLVAYAWNRHGAHAAYPGPDGPGVEEATEPALALLEAVVHRQAALVAQWMALGFIHGVMNTDNMTVSGQSIDFGPCAFMEAHDPATVFSSIDHHGRYAYGNQPGIAQWNLTRLAQALLPAMDVPPEAAAEAASEVLQAFAPAFHCELRAQWRRRLGNPAMDDEALDALVQDFHGLLQAQRVDHTLGWRRLCDAAQGHDQRLLDLFDQTAGVQAWLQRWKAGLGMDARGDGAGPPKAALAQTADAMRRASPFVIPRNHKVEEALAAASDEGDLQPFNDLLQALRRPWDEAPELQPFGEPAPAQVTACYRTFCGT